MVKTISFLSDVIVRIPIKISEVIDVGRSRGRGVKEDSIIILVNGEPSELDHVLRDEDTVVIMPVVGGG